MVVQKLPIVGEYFEREIPPSDNVSSATSEGLIDLLRYLLSFAQPF